MQAMTTAILKQVLVTLVRPSSEFDQRLARTLFYPE